MQADEASRIEERLRNVVRRLQLEWVETEADDSISLGVVEVRELRETATDGFVEPKVRTASKPAIRRRRTQEFLSTREMTPVERLEILVAALRRAVIDLPSVPSATFTILASDLDNVQSVDSMRFIDAEGKNAIEVESDGNKPAARLVEALNELAHEIVA